MIWGGADGRVYQGFTGFTDNASWDGTEPGTYVTGYFQTGFYDYGTPTQNKRAQRIRLVGLCDGTPGYIARIVSEYDFTFTGSPSNTSSSGTSLWDSATWDQSMWQSQAATFKKWYGVAGFGKKLSTQVAVRGLGATIVTDYEVTYENGIGL
jgi:hypothetical protein